MEPWNQTVIKPPPSVSVKILLTQEKRGAFVELERLMKETLDGIREPLLLLRNETAFIAQFYYKLSSVFRHDKAVKCLKKCLKAGKRLCDMGLGKLLLDFKQQITVSGSPDFFYGPSCSLLEHLLLRLQGATRLAAQLVAYSQHCGSLLLQKLSLGHFVNINVLSLASAARLWAASLSLMRQLIATFTELHKAYSNKLLPDSNVDHLPPEYQFPRNIEGWLRSTEDLHAILTLLVQAEDESVAVQKSSDIWETLTGIKDASPEVKSLIQSQETSRATSSFDEMDIGEAIIREDVPQPGKRKKKKQRNRGAKRLCH